ncbi:MAG TPA: alkaline phosphatase family protein [Allosphingosinicella sp.]|nr:alkaline phosphatase family protein [Allosphingosinicella sp.]
MKLNLLAAMLLAAAPAAARPQAADSPGRPRLIVAISVDQFSADLFAQYRQHFTGGLRRLANGIVFPAGYQSHAATETCPGHSTILTGARPARTGIIANNWYDQGTAREDKYIYCSEDERVPGSTSENYTVSPWHLRVPTLGDLMRRADPRSQVIAVAGKDRAAVMMGGHNPNERWWWDGRRFVSHAGAAEPAAVHAANARIAEALARPREAMNMPELCETRSRGTAVPGRDTTVGSGRFARAADDRGAFRASPDFDATILDLARALRVDFELGEHQAVDLLAIGLSATDYVGHGYGTNGSEMCIQLLALDRILGDFFQELDRANIGYAVVLTADHGGQDLPERLQQQAGAGARSDPALNARAMSETLARRLRLQGQVLYGDGPFGDMYVSRALPPRVRARVLNEAVATYRAHPQVAAVFTRAEIAATPMPSGPPDAWTLIQRARASFDTERSGDFIVLLRPRVTPIAAPSATGSVATHGSPWDYDRRVPILFWRRGLTGFEQPMTAETVDIMPTLAGLIGLPLAPGSVDGRCLDLVTGPETSCPH